MVQKLIFACKLVLKIIGFPLEKATFCSPGLPENLQSEILRPSLAESCTNVTFIIKSRKYDFCNPRAGKCKSLLTKSAKSNFPTIIRPPNPRKSIGKTKVLSPVLPEDRRSSRVLLQLTGNCKIQILSQKSNNLAFATPNFGNALFSEEWCRN